MTGGDSAKVAALPDTDGMRKRVVLPAGHAVNYGHPIIQAIRLAGAQPLLAGSEEACSLDALEESLAHPEAACLLLVSSRLVRGAPIDLAAAVAAAHRHGLPAIIDGAAQDMRMNALLATGADLVIMSAQKYLAAPTAGVVIGCEQLVSAVRAQEKGIGRGMKATKEAIVGLLKALEERERLDLAEWQRMQDEKVAALLNGLRDLPGIRAQAVPDPAGMPFARASLGVDADTAGISALSLARTLRAGSPPIWVMEHNAAAGELMLELVQLTGSECDLIVERISAALEHRAQE